jgi:hypothetical protein
MGSACSKKGTDPKIDQASSKPSCERAESKLIEAVSFPTSPTPHTFRSTKFSIRFGLFSLKGEDQTAAAAVAKEAIPSISTHQPAERRVSDNDRITPAPQSLLEPPAAFARKSLRIASEIAKEHIAHLSPNQSYSALGKDFMKDTGFQLPPNTNPGNPTPRILTIDDHPTRFLLSKSRTMSKKLKRSFHSDVQMSARTSISALRRATFFGDNGDLRNEVRGLREFFCPIMLSFLLIACFFLFVFQ